MPKRILKVMYHTCWYVCATMVLLAAVSITLIRLSLPYIDDYREEILARAGDHAGYIIKAVKIDASWQGWTPHLNLHGITVMDPASNIVLTSLQSVKLSINPLTSLLQRGLPPLRITVSGPELLIVREPDGAISIAQISPGGMSEERGKDGTNFFAEWLLQQSSVTIENAVIEYTDRGKQHTPLKLSNVNLLFKKDANRMQIDLSAGLPADYGQSLSLSLDAFGDITTPRWSGRIYAEGTQLYLEKFLALIQDQDTPFKINTAPSDFRLWSQWQDGRVNSIAGTIDAFAVELAYQQSTFGIQHLATQFAARRHDNKGYDIRLTIAELITDNGPWAPGIIDFSRRVDSYTGNPRYIAGANYLKIEDINSVLASFLEQAQILSVSDNVSLSGVLQNSLFIYEPDAEQPFYIESDIDYLSIRNNHDNSTVTYSGGYIEGQPAQGLIRLDSSALELSLPDQFENKLSLYGLTGDIGWKQTEQGLTFETAYLETHTPHFNAQAKGTITFDPAESPPHADLLFTIGNLELENVINYMPRTVPEKGRRWIKDALVSGAVPRLDIVLRGPLAAFPFRQHEGQFKVIANIQNAIVDYHKDWIPLDKLDAELLVDNNRLLVSGNSAFVYNAEIEQVTATIDNLFDSVEKSTRANGRIASSMEDARFIIDNSPLSTSEMLAELKHHDIKGPVAIDLNLDIPLNGSPLSFDGDLSLDQITLDSPGFGIRLDNINGNISFTGNDVTTQKLSADYFNEQVEIDINADPDTGLVFSIAGDADKDFIAGQFIHFFPELEPASAKLVSYLTGACHWSASLSPVPSLPGETAGPEKLLTVSSSLSGLSIDLPAPLGKNFEAIPLEISTRVGIADYKEKEINFTYGNHLAGNIVLQRLGESDTLARAELALGPDTKLLNSGDGIMIHGNVEAILLSDWHDFLATLDIGPRDGAAINLNVDLHARRLSYYNQEFADTTFTLNKSDSGMQVALRGSEIDGNISIPANIVQQPVKASFTRLHLQHNGTSDEGLDIDPRALPALELEANEFIYNTSELGSLLLKTTETENGLSIDSISFTKPELLINGNGTWEYIDDQEFSRFRVELDAKNLDAMLSTFNYSMASIKEGQTQLRITAAWHGAPMDFSLAGVNGDLSMEIAKGQVLDVEPAAGRLFGLLSLQTLRRRLSLDFSDLFGKGLAFDQISGTFTLEDGNAYTNDLTLRGPSADIVIAGRTGLIDEDYDQIATVTPQVSDSLPLASAFLGPIGAGAGAVIFLAGKLFKSIPNQIDKLLRQQYTISGSWEDPVVERFGSAIEPSG